MENLRITVDEINKREIGKLILKQVGNEGSEGSGRQQDLRFFLQNAITLLEKESTQVWRNAELNLCDKIGRRMVILSGKGENKFHVIYDGNDEVKLVCTEREPWRFLTLSYWWSFVSSRL